MAKNPQQTGRALTPRLVCEKFSRKKSWLWDRVKNDPTFPRPFYLSPRAPLFIESELDAYMAKLAEGRAT
jgi:predicted DNA-binding transcriptional regulator AlpA